MRQGLQRNGGRDRRPARSSTECGDRIAGDPARCVDGGGERQRRRSKSRKRRSLGIPKAVRRHYRLPVPVRAHNSTSNRRYTGTIRRGNHHSGGAVRDQRQRHGRGLAGRVEFRYQDLRGDDLPGQQRGLFVPAVEIRRQRQRCGTKLELRQGNLSQKREPLESRPAHLSLDSQGHHLRASAGREFQGRLLQSKHEPQHQRW
mmetsp:Transcript_27662/g.60917  ORF Transcript_27662/g.60917 Transcript_27662/m.60917 type:complete len:202 (-) Transcript_27662:284-889(-)